MMLTRFARTLLLLSSAAVLAGCVATPPPETYREPEVVAITETQSALRDLPAPTAKVPLAVYGFADKTGQFKPQENVQTLSRAVTQGGADLLIKALRDAGDGAWFTVLEREGLDNLLKERQIIRDMRQRYLGERRINPQALPPLLFAGVILEGGIVGFDSNTLTGGIGARFLGIGGDVKYRQNTIAVNLRAVSVKTGEVLANVSVDKTLASVGLSAGAFKFIDFDELIEAEAGVTNNEPGTLALRRAIEKAVISLVIEGSQTGLWAFADQAAAARLIAKNRIETHGRRVNSLAEVSAPGALTAVEAQAARVSRAPDRPAAPAETGAGVAYAQPEEPEMALADVAPSRPGEN